MRQHFEDISSDHNLQSLNILCLIETRLQSSFNEIHKFIDTSKYNHTLTFDGHGLLMLYDKFMTLDCSQTINIDGSEYIAATFNSRIRKAIHIICIYKAYKCSITMFLNTLQILV